MDLLTVVIIIVSFLLFFGLLYVAYRKVKSHLKGRGYEKQNAVTSLTIENNSRSKVYLHRASKPVEEPLNKSSSIHIVKFDLLLPTSANSFGESEDIEAAIVGIHNREKPVGNNTPSLFSSHSNYTPASTPIAKKSQPSPGKFTQNNSKKLLIASTKNSSNSAKSSKSNKSDTNLFQKVKNNSFSRRKSSNSLHYESQNNLTGSRSASVQSAKNSDETNSDKFDERQNTVSTPPSSTNHSNDLIESSPRPYEYFLERRQASASVLHLNNHNSH